jgi:hypothetical protein
MRLNENASFPSYSSPSSSSSVVAAAAAAADATTFVGSGLLH